MDVRILRELVAFALAGSVLVACGGAEQSSSNEDSSDALERGSSTPFDDAFFQLPNSVFFEIEQISLNADGSYTSNIDVGLTKSHQACVAAPCTVAESGTYGVTGTGESAKLTLRPGAPSVFNPDAKSREVKRVYALRFVDDVLELSRNRGVARFKAARMPTCAFVTCKSGTTCKETDGTARCAADQ